MRGLRVPIVIGLMFATLWVAGPEVATAQRNCPSPRATGSAPRTSPPCHSRPPCPGCVVLPSGIPSEPPSGPPPTDPPPPVTGSDLTQYVLLGAGLTVAGTGLVRLARKVADKG